MAWHFREYLLHQIPPPSLCGPWGSKLLGITALMADASMHSLACAVRAPWLRSKYSPDDALPLIGNERMMSAYPAETAATYRARLLDAWNAWGWAGDEASIEGQFEAAGYTATEFDVAGLLSWGRTNCEVTGGQEDPDGGDSAFAIVADASVPLIVRRLSTAVAGLSATVVDWEICLKAGDQWGVKFEEAYSSSSTYVNTTTGALGTSVGPASLKVFPTKDPEWRRYRYRMATTAGGALSLRLTVAPADGAMAYALSAASVAVYASSLRLTTPRVQVYTAQDWPTRGDTTHWSQFWVVLPELTHSAGDAHTWGSGLQWGTGAVWGGDLNPTTVRTVKAIPRKWKPGHWVCRDVLIEKQGGLWGTGLKWGMTGLKWGGNAVHVEVQP